MSGPSKERVEEFIRWADADVVATMGDRLIGRDRMAITGILRDLIATVAEEAAWVTCRACGGTGKVSRERVAELKLAEWLVDIHDRDPSNANWLRMAAVLARGESDRIEAERRKAREAE
jgi:hypothetical protein